ncbi:MAG: DEAD/DEAH box helicase [Myxococcales bacterium]|nr:DEAD/DEAH box helicase [Myxococcales bacterium]
MSQAAPPPDRETNAPGRFQAEAKTPWGRRHGLSAVLADWQGNGRVRHNLVLSERIDARPAHHAPQPECLGPRLRQALEKRGIDTLYAHQRRAFDLALAGRDLVIATPTASGKSLCYNLPVLHALEGDPEARAIYLFPTKALSRDQEEALRAMMGEAGLQHGAITYDGDTPGDARRAARERGGVLITNPDMLHSGILPHHANWARLFSNLRYVVIDELHVYRGVFGSHLSNVMRRLQRIARFHGSDPRFLMASATIGNPREHAARIIGRTPELIDESGAPSGARRVLVYNPPVVNQELGVRESYVKAAVRLSCDLVRAGISTLVFGQSRNNVEVMLKYLRDRLARDGIDPERIVAYRGGYLPQLRRGIESALRGGELACVVATNALELGIDIGDLDAVVCAGYPGSVAGLWQRFGRGGRRGEESLSLLVTSSAPLDQYIARGASQLLRAPIEEARIDPDNAEILVQHLKCGAFELPFERGEGFGDVPPEAVHDALDYLSDHRLLHPVEGARGKTVYHWASDSYPANDVSLRSVGWDNFVIIDVEHDRSIAEMDWRSTHTMLHEQAIYQHEGQQYQVERLDFENHKAFVRKVGSDYFTDAMTHVNVSVLEREQQAELGEARCEHGDVSVVEKVVGYKKIKYHSHENVGYGDVRLPEMQMHTTSFWLTVPEPVVARQAVSRPLVVDAMGGIAHALRTVACVGLMADPGDLGHAIGDRKEPDGPPGKSVGGAPGFDPTIFVFDRIPGGIGLSPRLFEAREELLRRARGLIQACNCDLGCPSCVGPISGELLDIAADVSRRGVALALLDDLGVSALH